MTKFTVLLLFLACAVTIVAQQPNCGETTGFSLNPEKPSIYIEFEQFGKADDWGGYKLGEPMKKPDIKKGDDIWLRLRNNSCWDITFRSLSSYMQLIPDPADASKKKLSFDLADGIAVNVAYVSQEQNSKVVPWGGDNFSVSKLPSGRSIVFPVYKEHLANGRSIYVPFNYTWEKDKWSDNLPPEHHSFFWDYRMEEVKKK
jgi:hypothetical protein